MGLIKAVLFDLDNTLVDFMKLKKLSCEQAISAMIDAGLRMDESDALKLLWGLYEKLGYEHQTIFQIFLKKAIGRVDYRILSAGIAAYRKVKAGFLEPYPHVTETLLTLKTKGLVLGIVTDAPRIQGWTRLAAMRLHYYFDLVVSIEDTREKKPSTKPFLCAMKRLRLDADEILFIGDSVERDIAGAHKVGMKTALALYGQTKKDKKRTKTSRLKPDYLLKDFSELLDILH